MGEPCSRTLAIYRPGVPIEGVEHRFAWGGMLPCTGVLRCMLCGERAPETEYARYSRRAPERSE
jgi:hypothetical protein